MQTAVHCPEAGSNTVNFADQNAGAVTVNDTGRCNDTLTLATTDAAADAFNGQAITVGGFETVNIVTTGTGAATAQSFGAIGLLRTPVELLQ